MSAFASIFSVSFSVFEDSEHQHVLFRLQWSCRPMKNTFTNQESVNAITLSKLNRKPDLVWVVCTCLSVCLSVCVRERKSQQISVSNKGTMLNYVYYMITINVDIYVLTLHMLSFTGNTGSHHKPSQ